MKPDWGKRRRRRFLVKDLTVSINGKTYRIFNINEYGMGFLIDSPEEIEIGGRIEPMIVNANLPVRVAGIPRHISQFRASDKHLYFKSGWVCGTEFATGHDRESRKLLREFIAENLDRDTDDAEK